MKSVSRLQWTMIILFSVTLLVWLISATRTKESQWVNNPWLPTMIIALAWGVYNDSMDKS